MGVLRRILRFDPRHGEDWGVWTLRLALAGTIPVAFFLPSVASGQTNPLMLAGTAVLALAAALWVSAADGKRLRALRVVELCLLLAFGLHLVGHVMGLYGAWPKYDSIVHGVGGFLAGIAGLALVRGTDILVPEGQVTRLRAVFVVVSVMAIFGVATEIVEYTSDRLAGTKEQTDPVQEPLKDTMWDFISETIGGAVAAVVAAASVHRGRVVPPGEAVEEARAKSDARSAR